MLSPFDLKKKNFLKASSMHIGLMLKNKKG